MYFLSLAILSLLAASGAGVPFPSTIVHEKRSHVPNSWIKKDRVNSSVLMPVRIGMTQSNLNRGYDMLMQVSHHDSPNYGKHYSAEEVANIFAPSKSTVEAVSDWLLSAGIAKDKISQSFDVLAEDLESLLNTEYHVYEHSLTGASDIACEKYHVPAHIQEHIDYITPGIRLLAPARKTSQARNEKRTFGITTGKGKAGFLEPLSKPLGMPIKELLAAPELQLCNVAITPACIKALYNITEPTKATPGNELGIFEDLGDVYSQADLNLFFQTLAQNIPQDTHPILEAIDGGVAPGPVAYAGAESNLDIQISYPLIYPQNSILFQTDDPVYESNYTYQGFLNNFLYAIDGSYCSSGLSPLDPQYPDTNPGGYNGTLQCGVYKAPNVLSISYGGQEADLPISYQQRQCNEFMKLGMQGISVVVSSGDVGVAGPPGDVNRNGCLGNGTIFSPDFPATCPYITTVGGTYLPPNGSVQASSEIAVSRFPSGGGFSNIYPSPSYQSSTVLNYLTTFPPPYKSYSGANNESFGANGGIYNKAGRAYPDVSAMGDNVLIFNEGYTMLIGGTSASTPIWASILTRINEERIAAGKGTVGFVNPVLYAHPEVLNDITVGSNPGCGTDGFAVTKGWDPVTGLGTPNYPALLDLFMSL